jgi:hypothetical protein
MRRDEQFIMSFKKYNCCSKNSVHIINHVTIYASILMSVFKNCSRILISVFKKHTHTTLIVHINCAGTWHLILSVMELDEFLACTIAYCCQLDLFYLDSGFMSIFKVYCNCSVTIWKVDFKLSPDRIILTRLK